MIKEMNENGIGAWFNMRQGKANDDIAKIKEEYPSRFFGMAHINPCEGQKALEDIERYVINGIADTIIMEPGQFFIEDPMSADDPRCYLIYAKCEKEGIIVILTFGGVFFHRLENYNPIYIDHIAQRFF